MEELSIEQKLALVGEVYSCRMFLAQGLGMLPANQTQDLRAPMLQLLAFGFEKLFKLTFCLTHLQREQALPTEKQLRKIGHSMLLGRDLVCEAIEQDPEYSKRPIANLDIAFLKKEESVLLLLSALTEWGNQGRYHDLTIFLTQGSASSSDPIEKWRQFENHLIHMNDLSAKVSLPQDDGRALAAEEIHVIQQVIRACGRLWTLGPGGVNAKRNSPPLQCWIGLMDSNLSMLAI